MAATSFSRLTTQDPGFSTDGVTLFRVAMRGPRYDGDASRIQLVESLEEQLRAVPGVETVAAASHVPIADCCSKFGLHVEGEVLESRVLNHETVAVVDDHRGCAKKPCIARVTYGADVELKPRDTVRAYGPLVRAITHEGKSIPQIEAELLVRGNAK